MHQIQANMQLFLQKCCRNNSSFIEFEIWNHGDCYFDTLFCKSENQRVLDILDQEGKPYYACMIEAI